MLAGMKRLLKMDSQSRLASRRRRLAQSLERLELRQLLATDVDFSTFFPSTEWEDGAYEVAQDSSGNAYVSDYRYDPVTFDYRTAISKLSPAGQLLWTQEIPEHAADIAVDDSGLVYLVAATSQDGLPTTPDAAQATRAGALDFYAIILDGNVIDGIAENLSTSELIFASYLGGTGNEFDTYVSLAIDADGTLFIAGQTDSFDLPTTEQAAVDSTYGGGAADGFIASFAPQTGGGYGVQLSTYLGGAENDGVRGIVVDAGGTIHAVGGTISSDFPLTANAIQTEPPSSATSRVGFVSRLAGDGSILYSTLLGGQTISDVAVDAAGSTYVVGMGGRGGFPVTPGAYAPEEVFAEDGVTRLNGTFVSKIDSSGALEHSSWFQPSRGKYFAAGARISLDGDLPVISGYDSGGAERTSFFLRFDSEISRIVDRVDVDTNSLGYNWIGSSNIIDGSLYVVGFTDNAAFETTEDAIFPSKNLGTDGYVRKYWLAPPPILFDASDDFDNGTPGGGSGDWLGPWQVGNNTHFITSNGPNDGTTHAIIQRRGSLTRQVDTAGVSNLSFSFGSKLRSFESADKAYVRVSPDGSNWTTLKTFVNGEDDNTYRDYSYDIPFETDTLWIKCEGGMSSRTNDYWYVDTVSISGEVIPNNLPPIANHDSFSMEEDGTLTVEAAAGVLSNDSDPEGQPITASLVAGPDHGSLTLNDDGSLVYTPDANFNGTELFSYLASDGTSDSNPATVTIQVAPVNDAPVAEGQAVSVKENTIKVIALVASSVDGDALTYSIQTGPNHGTLSGSAPNLNYTPDSGFNGTDSFTFLANDGSADSNLATVTITVAANQAPEADSQSVGLDEDTSLAINLSGSDLDGDSITYELLSHPTNGTLTGTLPNLTFTPDANFNGSDSFTFKVNDGTDDSGLATVSITVDPVNDPPVADSQSVGTAEDTPLGITLMGSDIDGDTLSYIIVSGPATGSLSGSGANRTYTPDGDFNGSDSFTFKVNDGTVDSALAIVSIDVAAVNDTPVAVGDSYEVDQDTSLSVSADGVLANDSDVDENALTAVPWSGSSDQGGQVVLNSDGSFTYTTPAGFTGTDTFSYTASDGSLSSDLATVSIEVQANNEDAMYVYDIRFESRYWGWQRRAFLEVRWDSNGDGQGGSADARLAGVSITVEFAGQTFSGTTDSNGIFRTNWIWNSGSGTYAEVVDMALADYAWDPLSLDLEDDSVDDGRPDAIV